MTMTEKDTKEIRIKWVDLFIKFMVVGVLTFVGIIINSTLKQQEIRVEYVQIAISILSEEPTDDLQPLRAWAVDVLQEYSPVPLDSLALELLKNKPFPARRALTTEDGQPLTTEDGQLLLLEE